MNKRVIVGISGASGAALGLKIGELLAGMDGVELHLVVTDSAKRTIKHEASLNRLGQLVHMADRFYDNGDVGAAIASGSFRTAGMIVAPCSMRTLAGITSGLSDSLLIRAADVQLKERRRLVLLARETPLHLGHLRNMVSVSEMGAIIMPPVPAFYRLPASVDDIVDHLARRSIDLLDFAPTPLATEWDGDA